MFSIEANTKNVLNISANNHKKLLQIKKYHIYLRK